MSTRMTLLAAIAECLRSITVANGYATDAGAYVTLEPGQIPADQQAVVAPVVLKQERASDPSQTRVSRLTTVGVVIKLPALSDQAQAVLDIMVGDVEQAMAGRESAYPKGYQFPQYQQMEPIPAEPGMGWVGALITYQTHIPIK